VREPRETEVENDTVSVLVREGERSGVMVMETTFDGLLEIDVVLVSVTVVVTDGVPEVDGVGVTMDVRDALVSGVAVATEGVNVRGDPVKELEVVLDTLNVTSGVAVVEWDVVLLDSNEAVVELVTTFDGVLARLGVREKEAESDKVFVGCHDAVTLADF
jgi:hypothetical protein